MQGERSKNQPPLQEENLNELNPFPTPTHGDPISPVINILQDAASLESTI
jgi:hypothetical protein